MRYVTSGERIEIEKAKREQALTLILRQLQRRVGELAESLKSRIQSLIMCYVKPL